MRSVSPRPLILEAAFKEAAVRVDVLRRSLGAIDSESLSRYRRTLPDLALRKASIYVWLAAALEYYVRTAIGGLILYLDAATIQHNTLTRSLFSLAYSNFLDSIRDLKGLKMWKARAGLFRGMEKPTPVRFSGEILPLDQRTLEPEHFDTLWEVFSFVQPSLPSPRHKLGLIEIATLRNKLAHGEISFEEVGRQKTNLDLQRLVTIVEDIMEHLYIEIDRYCSSAGFCVMGTK